MSSNDIKAILKKFYVKLRNALQPLEIYTEVEGLTIFDTQQIAATARNEGALLGSDKLLDAIGRRTLRTFASFIFVLKSKHPELAHDIFQYCQDFYPRIFDSLCRFQESHAVEIPRATVAPSRALLPLVGDVEVDHHDAAHGQLRSTVLQSRGSDFNENQGSKPTGNVVSTTEIHQKVETSATSYTHDTVLTDIDYHEISRWAEILNEGENWRALGKHYKLKWKEIKDLKSSENPGEDLLERMESCTLGKLLMHSNSAGLVVLYQEIQTCLGVEPENQNKEADNDRNQQQSEEKVQTDKDIEQILNKTPNTKMNISRSDNSIDNNEEVPETEDVVTPPKSITSINELKTTSFNFYGPVGNVSLPVSNGMEQPGCPNDMEDMPNGGMMNREISLDGNNGASTAVVNRGSDVSPTTDDRCGAHNLNREAIADETPQDSIDLNRLGSNDIISSKSDQRLPEFTETGNNLSRKETKRSDEPNVEQQKHGATSSESLNPPDSLSFVSKTSLPDLDSPENASLESNQENKIVQPHQSDASRFEKNADQDLAGLRRDLENQINLDSYRDIQNSIPGTPPSGQQGDATHVKRPWKKDASSLPGNQMIDQRGSSLQQESSRTELESGEPPVDDCRVQPPIDASISRAEENADQKSKALQEKLKDQDD